MNKTIKLSQAQIKLLQNTTHVVKTLTVKKSLGKEIISKLHSLPLEGLKKQMEQVTLEGLKNDFTKWENKGALFLAMFNPDFEVFKHIYNFCKKHKFDLPEILMAPFDEFFKNDGKTYYWENGDTLLNLALVMAEPERIKFLINEGINQINCNNVIDVDGEEIVGNLLTLATQTIKHSQKINSLNLEEKAKYYLDFALTGDEPEGNKNSSRFDKQMKLKPYSSKNESYNAKIIANYICGTDYIGEDLSGALVFAYYQPLYENENFVKLFIPHIITAACSNELAGESQQN